jgi:hypothetical protein
LGVVDAGGLEPGVGEPRLGGHHLIGGLGLDSEMIDRAGFARAFEEHQL